MKKSLITAAAVLALAGSAFSAERIAFVDLERAFNEFYKTQLAKSKIDVQRQDVDAERKVLTDEMTAINNDVDALRKDAQDTTLAGEIRDSKRLQYEERLLDLRAKQKELDEFTTRRQQQLEAQVSRMSQTIMEEIRQEIVSYAKTEGFSAVIDSSSRRAAVGVFIYVHPDVDITDKLLASLNSKRSDTAQFRLDETPATNNAAGGETP